MNNKCQELIEEYAILDKEQDESMRINSTIQVDQKAIDRLNRMHAIEEEITKICPRGMDDLKLEGLRG